MPCFAAFFSFLAVRFSLRFLPGVFFSLPRGCLDPICSAYAHATLPKQGEQRRLGRLRPLMARSEPPATVPSVSASSTAHGKGEHSPRATWLRPMSETPTNPLDAIVRVHRVRRLCALGLGLIGVFDLVTSVLPPSRHHLSFLLRFAPLVVTQAAAVLLALCGLVLLALTRGLRRGQRQAWVLSGVVLVLAVLLHLARGIDGVQSALGLVL